MKTRRSPRNQEILWRALSGKPEPITKAPLLPLCAYCVNFFSNHGRSRGECTLRGTIVNCTSKQPCFVARAAIAKVRS